MSQTRISDESLYRTINTDLMRQLLAQNRTATEISSNTRVSAPSDSDYAVTILRSQNSLSQVDQYRTNLDSAMDWLTASESSLQSIVTLLSEAEALAEQMSTGTYQASEQAAAATEVANLISQIISLANTSINGAYIFAGTDTDLAPILSALTMAEPATVASDSPQGHNTLASVYQSGGSYYLRLARQSAGDADTITIAAANTLGETGTLGLSFDGATFTHSQTGATSPAVSDEYTSTQALASLTALVSDRLGEELTFTGAGGAQTYRTDATVTFSGAGAAIGDSVTVGGDTYTFAAAMSASDSAAWLADQINSTAGLNYYATVAGGVVTLHALPASAFDVTASGANLSVDQTTSLTQLNNEIGSGLRASGTAHLSDATLPADTETVTLNGYGAWDWGSIISGVIPPAAATAANYAAALSSYVNSHTSDYTASVSSSGTGATVTITANDVGTAGNVALTASVPANVITSGSLYGGLDGADTTASIYASGTSSLRLATTVNAEVLAVDSTSGDATLRLSWYDDEGAYQTVDYVIPEGEDSAVTISELGGIQLYRDSLNMKVGATFTLDLEHYQGNDGDLEVNFSTGSSMRINWNAGDLLGDQLGVNLDGVVTVASRESTLPLSTGNVELSGLYRGLASRDISFTVIDAGQVPDDHVTLRATWTDDQGEAHSQELTFDTAGQSGIVALPVFGDTPLIELEGDSATAAVGNTGAGAVNITGTYTGNYPRDISFSVASGGQLPDTDITLTATWTDEDGVSHSEDVTISESGAEGAVEIPGCDGVEIYLDEGSFVEGETFSYELSLDPAHAGDAIYVNLDTGDFKVGDTFSYTIEKDSVALLDILNEWQYQLESGDQEAAQTQSQRTLEALSLVMDSLLDAIADSGTRQDRITVREGVMDDQELYHTESMENLREVDTTQAFLDLQAQQTAYSASLQVISTISGLSLMEYL